MLRESLNVAAYHVFAMKSHIKKLNIRHFSAMIGFPLLCNINMENTPLGNENVHVV